VRSQARLRVATVPAGRRGDFLLERGPPPPGSGLDVCSHAASQVLRGHRRACGQAFLPVSAWIALCAPLVGTRMREGIRLHLERPPRPSSCFGTGPALRPAGSPMRFGRLPSFLFGAPIHRGLCRIIVGRSICAPLRSPDGLRRECPSIRREAAAAWTHHAGDESCMVSGPSSRDTVSRTAAISC